MDEFSPYVMVAIQESERMNVLLAELRRSLDELDLGLKGDLTMTEPMENLMKVGGAAAQRPGDLWVYSFFLHPSCPPADKTGIH